MSYWDQGSVQLFRQALDQGFLREKEIHSLICIALRIILEKCSLQMHTTFSVYEHQVINSNIPFVFSSTAASTLGHKRKVARETLQRHVRSPPFNIPLVRCSCKVKQQH